MIRTVRVSGINLLPKHPGAICRQSSLVVLPKFTIVDKIFNDTVEARRQGKAYLQITPG